MINRATLTSDLAQVWLEIDTIQSLYFEPGRLRYRAAMATAGVPAPLMADPAQMAFSGNLSVTIQGLDHDDDTTLAQTISHHIMTVLSALVTDSGGSDRSTALLARLCLSVLPQVSGASVERQRQRQQRERLNHMLNMAAYYQLALAVMQNNNQDKQSAHRQRLRFTEIGLQLKHAVSALPDQVFYEQISHLMAWIGEAYRNFSDALNPVGYYQPPEDLSVLAVAWNIYQDPTWAEDLRKRNAADASVLLRQPLEYLTPPSSGNRIRY